MDSLNPNIPLQSKTKTFAEVFFRNLPNAAETSFVINCRVEMRRLCASAAIFSRSGAFTSTPTPKVNTRRLWGLDFITSSRMAISDVWPTVGSPSVRNRTTRRAPFRRSLYALSVPSSSMMATFTPATIFVIPFGPSSRRRSSPRRTFS